jgi:sec-independent protein translocase protein TatC
VVEPFLIRFKVALFTGLAIALPIILYQLWRFITPGLTRKERRLAFPFVLSSLLLFALGGWFAYLTLTKGLHFLLGFAGTTIVPFLTVDRYINFVLFMGVAFGLSFEFPLVLLMLCWVHVLSSSKLRAWRRWAWLGITVYAAVITPSQDPFTQLAMMIPMIVFYEVVILVARAMKR